MAPNNKYLLLTAEVHAAFEATFGNRSASFGNEDDAMKERRSLIHKTGSGPADSTIGPNADGERQAALLGGYRGRARLQAGQWHTASAPQTIDDVLIRQQRPDPAQRRQLKAPRSPQQSVGLSNSLIGTSAACPSVATKAFRR
ncbi:hypothetical protein ACIGKR_31670 [Rhodococcus qingshengii]|uniref:hypothetical protein n=1 Tax=Rhodococcus qingshengii TaxID=334542 RepID=UPI0037C643D7